MSVTALATRPVVTTTVASLAVGLAAFGVAFAEPTLVENFTPVDLVIGGIAAIALVHALAGDSRIGDVCRRLALPAACIAIGSLAASLTVGLTKWIVGDLIRDVGIALAFLGVLDLTRRDGERALRAAGWALATGATAVSLHLTLFDSALRARATFANPNVAGHFLATALIGMQALPLPRWLRRTVTVLVLVALARTSSFGALLQVTVGALAMTSGRVRAAVRGQPQLLVATAVAAVVVGALAWQLVPDLLPERSETSGLSSSRLERSAGGRFDTWGEGVALLGRHPFGVGPGSTNGLQLLEHEQELHNEPLAYLVERGPLAFAGFVLLGVALWRLAPRSGVARALLLGFAVSSLVRETSHYRHLWVVLALAIVSDERGARERRRAP